jgi:glucosamine--fructose-6-phosphate aminotransferase (isomerizing)
MCGVVGILGREPVTASLIDALKRLEYRGYDSAGVATLEGGRLARRRAEGKLRKLEARLAREPLTGTTGIGHTRWATHGRPTESNAHPHATDRLAVVHNGIIENFRELREELERNGAKFGSDTESSPTRDRGDEERLPARQGGGRGATAAAWRFRARLPVHGRGQSPHRRA